MLAQCGTDSTAITIHIRTDQYHNETSWQLTGLTDTFGLIEEGDLNVVDSLYSWNFCVPSEDCVSFSIYDDFGDGIFAPGFYSVEVDEEEVAFGATFGSSETKTLICTPGQNCNNGILARLDSIYTAETNNTYYEFTADTTGNFSISTCDLNDCDTKIWVYGQCPATLPPDDNEGTIFYDDNEGGCNSQAKVNALLEQLLTTVHVYPKETPLVLKDRIWKFRKMFFEIRFISIRNLLRKIIVTLTKDVCRDTECGTSFDLVLTLKMLENSIIISVKKRLTMISLVMIIVMNITTMKVMQSIF